MEIEIWLDLAQASPENYSRIDQHLRTWHAEGAEIRYDKACFGSMTKLKEPHHYRVDLGNADPLTAIRELHARLYRLGVKVFVHFVPE